MYEFRLTQPVLVSRVFDYLGAKLGADATAYGGSAMMADDGHGNTIFEVLKNRRQVGGCIEMGIAYVVNPHAGQFVNVGRQTTNQVTVTPLGKQPLSDEQVREIQRELAGLR